MIVRTLECKDYRNYRNLKMDFDPGINLLYGDNAQGKTNALEAIFLCAAGKSHRGTRDRELISFDKEEAHVKLVIEKKGVPWRIDLHLKKGRAKGVAVNGTPIRKVTELYGIFHAIFFSPEDLAIIKNAPSERRRFLDLELCQLDRIYTHNLLHYNQVVNQRNKLLKDLERDPQLLDTLDVWDEQMVRYGLPVIERRRRFLAELNEIMTEIHASLTGGKEEIHLTYAANISEEMFVRKLASGRERDRGAKISLTGPHRDDMIFEINGVDVRHFGSQGQQRTAALSLKLAEIALVKERTKDTPVLLLDDVLSELDSGRQERLLQSIEGIQTMITCTGLDDFAEHCFQIDKVFHIENGGLTEENAGKLGGFDGQ